MSPSTARNLIAATVLSMTPACSIHSVATHWNGRVGQDGHPVYVRRVTNIGVNLLIIVPVLGSTSIDEMIDESTGVIADFDSDNIRVIESSSENYWHGFPPFTWFITPVITEVAVEYRPSEREIAEVLAADESLREEVERRRQEQDKDSQPDTPPPPQR